ncbi:hypothetical protein HanRHA438_Chr03g0120061 [Helianthus annuus]|nr:hypothetical protein HanRHA438_Chr03g0120061 [Helianthus annuus]
MGFCYFLCFLLLFFVNIIELILIVSCFHHVKFVVYISKMDEKKLDLDAIGFELQNNPTSIKDMCTNHINYLCKTRQLSYCSYYRINTLPAYNLLLAAACEKNDTQTALHVLTAC